MTQRRTPPRTSRLTSGPNRPEAVGPTPQPAVRPEHVVSHPHVVTMPAPSAEPPAEQMLEEKGVSKSLIITVIAIGTLLVGGAWYGVVHQPEADFVEQYVDVIVTRNLPESATVPSRDEEITTQKTRFILRDGRGLRLVLITKEDGKLKEKKQEILIEASSNPNAGERGGLLDQAWDKVGERVEKFNKFYERVVKWSILVDSSSGDPKLLEDQLNLRLGPSMVEQATKKGYEVRAIFHRIGESPFSNVVGEPIQIGPKTKDNSSQDQIAARRKEIVSGLRNEQRSEIILGVLNTIHEDGLVAGDHALIFSDMLEYSRFFKWETGTPADVAEDKWDDIFNKIEAAAPNFPKLEGLIIDVYLPNRPEKAEMMIATIKLWRGFFQKHKAIFREHL